MWLSGLVLGDDAVPVEVAERAAALLGNSTLSVLDDVGHFVPAEAPGALADAVLRCRAALA